MIKAYIAGPMTGYPNHNFDTFDQVKRYLEDFHPEFEVLCPRCFDATHPLDDPDWGDYLKRDIKHGVLEAHRLIMLPGWQLSRGATLEAFLASRLSIPVQEIVWSEGMGWHLANFMDPDQVPVPPRMTI